MRAFFLRFQPWCTIAAAMILALLGIFEVIDQPTMIALVVVLAVIAPASCAAPRREVRP